MRQLIRGHVLIIQLIGTFAARIVNMHAGKVLGLQTTDWVIELGFKGFILVNFIFTVLCFAFQQSIQLIGIYFPCVRNHCSEL